MTQLLDINGLPLLKTIDKRDDRSWLYCDAVFRKLRRRAGSKGHVDIIKSGPVAVASKIGDAELVFVACVYAVRWPHASFSFMNTFYMNPTHCPPPPDFMPLSPSTPAAHACVSASLMILNAIECKQQVYEGEEDGVIDIRQIVTSTATAYNVDPTEMMAYYPAIKWMLASGNYTPPVTLESAIASKKEKVRNTDGLNVGVKH